MRLGRSQPIRPTIVRGPVAPGLLLDSVTDNYDDNAINTAIWSDNFGTTSETGQQAVVQCSTGLSGFQTGKKYGLYGSTLGVLVQVYAPAASTATTAFADVYVYSDQQAVGTALQFKADAATGLLTAANLVGGTDGGASTVAFDPLNPVWLWIQPSGGNLLFRYSTSGTSISWTTLRTLAMPGWVTTSAVGVALRAQRDAGVTDSARFDNFNLPAADPIPAPPVTIAGGGRPRPLPPGATILRAPDARPVPTNTVAVGLDGALPLPLSVRFVSDLADTLFVEALRDFTCRSAIPGGFASATFTIDKKLAEEHPEIKQFGRVYVYHTASGDTVWEGRLEDPGKAVGPEGELWQLTAIGPSAHARDDQFAYPLIDRTLGHFEKFGGSKANTGVGTSTDSSDRDGIKVSAPGGTAIGTPAYVSARSLRVYSAGADLGRVSATWYSSDTSPSWEARMYVYTDGGSAELIDSATITTTPTSFSGVVGTDFTDGANSTHLRMDKITTSSTPADEVNVFWYDVCIQIKRVDEEGVAVTSYPNDYVTASEVVQDLIGGHTTEYDGLDAYIEITTNQIEQLAYDSTTVYDVLNDLMALEGAYYWAAWETIPRSGLWRIEFRPWPTHVRYEAGVDDSFDQPQSAGDLYNKVVVLWEDEAGREHPEVRTSTVPSLDAIGLTRATQLNLGKELGTLANAQLAGDAFLAEHNLPNRNGRLIIGRPILDYDRGMMVDPCQIRPGGLIRVRNVNPERNALNPDGRDGVTVFRIVGVNYRTSDNTAELELDTDALSTSRAIAQLQGQRIRS